MASGNHAARAESDADLLNKLAIAKAIKNICTKLFVALMSAMPVSIGGQTLAKEKRELAKVIKRLKTVYRYRLKRTLNLPRFS